MKNERRKNLKKAIEILNARGELTAETQRTPEGIQIIASEGMTFCVINEADIPEGIQTAQVFEEFIEAKMAIRLLNDHPGCRAVIHRLFFDRHGCDLGMPNPT